MLRSRSNTYSILIWLFLILTSSIFYYIFHMEHKTNLEKTKLEIKGLYILEKLFDSSVKLEYNRALSQLKDEEFIRKNYYSSTLNDKTKKIADDEILRIFNKISNNYAFSEKEHLKYDELIDYIHKKKVDIADKCQLLFEADRKDYFLMSLIVYHLPSISDDISHLVGIGIEVLNNKRVTADDAFKINKDIENFNESMADILSILSKLDSRDLKSIYSDIKTLNNEYKNFYFKVQNFLNKDYKTDSISYFNDSIVMLDKIKSIYENILQVLIDDFENRVYKEKGLLFKSLVIYLIFIILSSIVLFIILRQNRKEKIKNEVSKKRKEMITLLQKNLMKSEGLKDICENSLKTISNILNATNGSLYLYNKNEKKLSIGAIYNLNISDINHFIDVNENHIGEVSMTKEIKQIDAAQNINIGNISIYVKSIANIPLVSTENTIGVIQLSLPEKIKDEELELVNDIANITASYIYKAQKENESLKYLELLNKNVLTSSTDVNGIIINASDAFCKISGYKSEELIGVNHNIIKHPDMPVEIYEDIWETITSGAVWEGEIKNKTKDGAFYWVHSIISPDYDFFGNITGYTAIRHDITLKKEFEVNAITDSLTGLNNRRYFDEVFEDNIKITNRANRSLVFILMDIDHFKQYNDEYGHQAGDITLKAVASMIKKTLHRPDDFSFRLGGEEFGILFTIDDEVSALEIANKVRENIESMQIPHIKNSASSFVTISSGVYIIRDNEILSCEEIYKKADEALYDAKENGRNQVIISN